MKRIKIEKIEVEVEVKEEKEKSLPIISRVEDIEELPCILIIEQFKDEWSHQERLDYMRSWVTLIEKHGFRMVGSGSTRIKGKEEPYVLINGKYSNFPY